MKAKQIFLILLSCVLLVLGCSSGPVLKMPDPLPPIVREYKHITIHGNHPGMVNTGVYLNKGEYLGVFVKGRIIGPAKYRDSMDPEQRLLLRYGEAGEQNSAFKYRNLYSYPSPRAYHSGYLYMGINWGYPDGDGEPKNPSSFQYLSGSFQVDIIVWKNQDYVQMAALLKELKDYDPENYQLEIAYNYTNNIAQTTLEMEKTRKEIQSLTGEPEKENDNDINTVKETKITPPTKPVAVDVEKQEKVAELEAKLAKLTETLAQLEEMKKELSASREKSTLLSLKLKESQEKEENLMVKLGESSKAPPIIFIASPRDDSNVDVNFIHISGIVEDDRGLAQLEIFINNKPIDKELRGLRLKGNQGPKRINFNERIPLEKGENQIRIRAVDTDNLWAERMLKIQRSKIRRNIWAVIIGINEYPNVRHLKFAVNDAKALYDQLVSHSYIPVENVTLLLDQEATLTKVRSILGTHLKNKAGKDDMVIIFFAGHGAIEKDAMSPDGDGLEKYILPYNADPKDLYATALPMDEISRVFNRIRSERLVFIADSCYSGASGGRTIGITGTRSNISENFLNRVTSGKGRVIITASGSNEVSAENEDLQHGVFTYYLLEGLKGKADMDKDGLITVDEAYLYVSEQVPHETDQEQHPVKKGTVEGRLILGVVE